MRGFSFVALVLLIFSLTASAASEFSIVDVRRDYGARGDGVTDDTVAIQRAIRDNRDRYQRTLYLPAGTYLVSDTLDGRKEGGIWRSRLTIEGAGRDRTIIRLKDRQPGFVDPAAPRPVLMTGSIEPWDQTTGAGYNGFRNNVFDLSIDIGQGNPGAVGIDYLGNNICAIRNVRVVSSDPGGLGAVGLRSERRYGGPCLYQNLEIDGFDFGIRISQDEYSHTFEHLILRNQRRAGLVNAGNIVSIHDLEADGAVPMIENTLSGGLITLVGAELHSRAETGHAETGHAETGHAETGSAIRNDGEMLLHDVRVEGFSAALSDRSGENLPAGTIAAWASRGLRRGQDAARKLTLDLPIEAAPLSGAALEANARSVTEFGAKPDGRTDSTAALQTAFNQDAATVYLPTGDYAVSQTITIGGSVRRIIGFGAVILPTGAAFGNPETERVVFRIGSRASDLTIEQLQFGWATRKDYPGVVWIEDDSRHTLVLRDVDFEGEARQTYRTGPGSVGPLFLEDVSGMGWEFRAPQTIWARQLNPESHRNDQPHIVNHGATLWILGLKTEGPSSAVVTDQGGKTEILGGLLYPVREVTPDAVAFDADDAALSAVYATEANRSSANYDIQFRHDRKDRRASDMAPRGHGTLGADLIERRDPH